MGIFKSPDELYETFGALFKDVQKSDLGKGVGNSGLVVKFDFADPEAQIVLDCRKEDVTRLPGEHFSVSEKTSLTPDIEMWMRADLAHKFWFGKVNLLTALTTRRIVAKGSLPKLLKFLPILRPLYTRYPEVLQILGKEWLVIY